MATIIGATQSSTASPALGNVSAVSPGTVITANTYRSMLTVIEGMLQHNHTVVDTYWSNCECQCGGGGTT